MKKYVFVAFLTINVFLIPIGKQVFANDRVDIQKSNRDILKRLQLIYLLEETTLHGDFKIKVISLNLAEQNARVEVWKSTYKVDIILELHPLDVEAYTHIDSTRSIKMGQQCPIFFALIFWLFITKCKE